MPPDRLQVLLSYGVLIGLVCSVLLAALNGYFLFVDTHDPARQIENLPIQPSGPQILPEIAPPPPTTGTIPSDEFLLNDRALGWAIALTVGAFLLLVARGVRLREAGSLPADD
ncbi:MAG: hypothetical protein WC277_11450 [Bacilli bacterium]